MTDYPEESMDGGPDVLFEETLSLQDEAGARDLLTWTRVLAVFMVVVMLGGTVLVVGSGVLTFASEVGSPR